MKFALPLLFLLSWSVGGWFTQASSILPKSTGEMYQDATAVGRGTVRQVECFRDARDGLIYTRALVDLAEGFKGIFPRVVQVIHLGGTLDGEGLTDGLNPHLQVGEERLFFLGRRKDGTLFSLAGGVSAPHLERAAAPVSKRAQFVARHEALLSELRGMGFMKVGGADVTDQAGLLSAEALAGYRAVPPVNVGPTNGLDLDTNGYPSRYTQPDRGEPIGYLVDTQFLPAGITTNQATDAVSFALNAWAAVTGIKFRFDGFTNFGNAAQASTNLDGSSRKDGRLRIQLHDAFNVVPGGSVLGLGGWASSFFTNTPWGLGGSVIGNEFNLTTRGHLSLEHTNAALGNTNDLAEVLCHEIGHTLGLMHSSELTNEPNLTLSNAMMYFQVHKGGRGATLGAYDPPVAQQAHPPTNTPPYAYDRMLDVVTTGTGTVFSNLNIVTFLPLDLQGTNGLSLATNNGSTNGGTFSISGLAMRFTQAANYGDTGRLDPAGNSSFNRIDVRVSDGTNASPFVSVRVLSFINDSKPTGAPDGLPDSWMTTYFGNADPAAGANRGATNDFDGDGYSNLAEFLLGSDPTRGDSHLRIQSLGTNFVTFAAKPHELYDLQTSTNMSNWVRAANPVSPTNAAGIFTNLALTNLTKQFIRIVKVP